MPVRIARVQGLCSMAGTAGCRLLQASGPVHCRPPPRLVFYGCGWWALLNLLVEHSDMRIF